MALEVVVGPAGSAGGHVESGGPRWTAFSGGRAAGGSGGFRRGAPSREAIRPLPHVCWTVVGIEAKTTSMLASLHTSNVGPAPYMHMELASRLNLITGDNGLGKSLLLDAAWFALTGTWPATWSGRGLVPTQAGASIVWSEGAGTTSSSAACSYDFADARWTGPSGSWGRSDLVVYLRVDGGVSVYDPLRSGEDFRLPFGAKAWDTSNVFQFRENEIWDGLSIVRNQVTSRVCEGLVRDVAVWALDSTEPDFDVLAALVTKLGRGEGLSLQRRVKRVFVDEARDYPMLAGPGGEVPVIHAAAGIRRILGLAYILVWTLREHRIAAELRKVQPAQSMVLLVDEVEAHLHPRWQREIVSGLVGAGLPDAQCLITTHSPLVLASVEPYFDSARDKLFTLELVDRGVALREQVWSKQGDVANWLVSESFGLRQGRSIEAERAIEAAEAYMRSEFSQLPANLATKDAIHSELLRVLAGHDPFWPRWVVQLKSEDVHDSV